MKPGIWQSYTQLLVAVTHLFVGCFLIFATGYVAWMVLRAVAVIVSGEYR